MCVFSRIAVILLCPLSRLAIISKIAINGPVFHSNAGNFRLGQETNKKKMEEGGDFLAPVGLPETGRDRDYGGFSGASGAESGLGRAGGDAKARMV